MCLIFSSEGGQRANPASFCRKKTTDSVSEEWQILTMMGPSKGPSIYLEIIRERVERGVLSFAHKPFNSRKFKIISMKSEQWPSSLLSTG